MSATIRPPEEVSRSGGESCPSCGAPKKPGVGFCGNCGQAFAPMQPAARKRLSQSMKPIPVLLAAALLLGLAALAVTFVTGRSERDARRSAIERLSRQLGNT